MKEKHEDRLIEKHEGEHKEKHREKHGGKHEGEHEGKHEGRLTLVESHDGKTW